MGTSYDCEGMQNAIIVNTLDTPNKIVNDLSDKLFFSQCIVAIAYDAYKILKMISRGKN